MRQTKFRKAVIGEKYCKSRERKGRISKQSQRASKQTGWSQWRYQLISNSDARIGSTNSDIATRKRQNIEITERKRGLNKRVDLENYSSRRNRNLEIEGIKPESPPERSR